MFTTITALLRVLSKVAVSSGYLNTDVSDALVFGANLIEVGTEGKAELEALVYKWEDRVARGVSLTDEERQEQLTRSDELSRTLQALATDVPEPELATEGAAANDPTAAELPPAGAGSALDQAADEGSNAIADAERGPDVDGPKR